MKANILRERTDSHTQKYKKKMAAIIGDFPLDLDEEDFPGEHIDTDFGWVKSHVIGNKEYCLEKISNKVPMHYLEESKESVYILNGTGLIYIGNEPGETEQKYGQAIVVSEGSIITRPAKTAWQIEPIQASNVDIPFFIRGLLDPPFSEEQLVKVKIRSP